MIKWQNAFLSKNLDIAVFFGILTVGIAIEKVHKMTDISNTEYITINKDGIFVGGKPATTYRGKHIYCLNYNTRLTAVYYIIKKKGELSI